MQRVWREPLPLFCDNGEFIGGPLHLLIHLKHDNVDIDGVAEWHHFEWLYTDTENKDNHFNHKLVGNCDVIDRVSIESSPVPDLYSSIHQNMKTLFYES